MCVADPDPKDFEGCEIITRIRFGLRRIYLKVRSAAVSITEIKKEIRIRIQKCKTSFEVFFFLAEKRKASIQRRGADSLKCIGL